jgi:hypothetical protein
MLVIIILFAQYSLYSTAFTLAYRVLCKADIVKGEDENSAKIVKFVAGVVVSISGLSIFICFVINFLSTEF